MTGEEKKGAKFESWLGPFFFLQPTKMPIENVHDDVNIEIVNKNNLQFLDRVVFSVLNNLIIYDLILIKIFKKWIG
jgi:hypothetical protein